MAAIISRVSRADPNNTYFRKNIFRRGGAVAPIDRLVIAPDFIPVVFSLSGDTLLMVNGDKEINSFNGMEAFEALVRANQGWVRGYLRSRLQDWASADDLAQDVFVTAYLKRRHFRAESTIEVWLCGIARNHLRNFLRKHREQAVGGSEELQEMVGHSGDGWESTDGRLLALSECLQQLSSQARWLLDERYSQGRNVREIARETGKGYSALTMQFHRMREQLAACIERRFQGGNV